MTLEHPLDPQESGECFLYKVCRLISIEDTENPSSMEREPAESNSLIHSLYSSKTCSWIARKGSMLLFTLKVKSTVGGEARMSQPGEERIYMVPPSSYSSFWCMG